MSFPPLPTMHPEAAATIATEVISNPHVQGGIQAFTGLAEVGAGVTMTYASGGFAVPLGWLAVAHGFDHFVTGINQAFNGVPIDTATSTLLQHAGMSRSWANCVDYSASFGLITKGAAVARAAQLGYSNFYQSPVKQIASSEISSNPLKGTNYTRKVFAQMEKNLKTGQPDFHGFPRIVDNYARFGKKELIKGRDSIIRTKIRLEGSYQNYNGHFEWIIESDKSINHRIFMPNP